MTRDPEHTVRFHELRRIIRLRKAQFVFMIASVRLLWAAWRGELKEIWVGDSHSAMVPSTTMGAPLRPCGDGVWSCHLGPRLMYSIAREGLPANLIPILRLISRTKNASSVLWIFSFGEIDTRCHLAPRLQDPGAFDFVARYLHKLHTGAQATGAARVMVLVPYAASDKYPEQTGFPKVGTLAERVQAIDTMRTELHKAAAALPAERPQVLLLDCTDEMVDETGAASDATTSDGVHTNDNGRAILRREINRLLAEPLR